MVSYLIRRLLLMIPTLIGITFVVFMLVALSPGGIGAGLRAAGGQMEATSRAIQEAYLNDRYGLDDPVPVQYLRWLSQISPVKVGNRALVQPDGERVRRPRQLDSPLAWQWFTEELEVPAPEELPEELRTRDSSAEDRDRAFRRVDGAFAQARARYVSRRAMFQQELAGYLRATGHTQAVRADGTVRSDRLRSIEFDPSHERAGRVEELGRQMLDAYGTAQSHRTRFIQAMNARPYPMEGIGIGRVALATPDLGRSFSSSRPVSQLIAEALPITLLLNVIASVLIYMIAVPSGILAATRQGTTLDTGMGALFVALWSFPIPLAGVLAIGFLSSNDYLGWFPTAGLHSSGAERMTFLPTVVDGEWTRGYLLDALWHLCLPVACLVYGGFAVLSKQTRAAMLDNFNADYVRTAKAKGVQSRHIIFRHVFRNSLLPLITMFVSIFPAMLSGSVVIETIFSINGMGRLTLDAIYQRDREVILATTAIISAVNIAALLLADVLYAMADPRITYS